MEIKIFADRTEKKIRNFWNNIHFHPTDAIEDDWGRRILDTVAEENVADTVRMYSMFEDIVTEKDGELFYDFTENDIRLDYMVKKGFKLLICYNFIPPFLAKNPELKSASAKNKTRYKGKMIVNSVPNDYGIWREICRKYTEHIIERYGEDTVSQWYLHCYNEPDISPFFMGEEPSNEEGAMARLAEYKKLYRGFAAGIDSACDAAGLKKRPKIGGPTLAHFLGFFDGFLKFVKEEKLHLDFICAHTYGTNPKSLEDGTKPLDVENNYELYKGYIDIVDKYFPESVEFILDEWGASSAGFCDKDTTPKMIFRETEVFATYFAKLVTRYIERDARLSKHMICLSGQHEMTEDFSGFRNFFSLNFIKKPIYNAHVLLRKLEENVLCRGELPENMTLLATKNDNEKYSLLLTYSADKFDGKLEDKTVKLSLCGMCDGKKKVTLWRIDGQHTNPYRIFEAKGYDKVLTDEQIKELRRAATLVPCEEYDTECKNGICEFEVTLSDNGTVLAEIN